MGMKRRAVSVSTLLALLVFGSACASTGRDLFTPASRGDTEVMLTTENQNFSDAVVYAIWGAGSRVRLGMVTGGNTETFELNVRRSELRVEVDFIGGRSYTSEPIGVFPGDDLRFTIPPRV